MQFIEQLLLVWETGVPGPHQIKFTVTMNTITVDKKGQYPEKNKR